VLTENTQKEGDSEAAAASRNTDSGPMAPNGKERGRASAQEQKKKEEHILMIRHAILD
jgi:hypothetical protein